MDEVEDRKWHKAWYVTNLQKWYRLVTLPPRLHSIYYPVCSTLRSSSRDIGGIYLHPIKPEIRIGTDYSFQCVFCPYHTYIFLKIS